jgi:hypothetical protein
MDGKVFELKKKVGRLVEVSAGYFFPTDSPMDSKRQLI